MTPRVRRVAVNGLLALGAGIAAFVVIEGTASLALLGFDLAFNRNPGPASQRHATYDTLLGWVNTPSLVIPDMYGPGESLSINARSFRGREVSDAIPPGRTRILCSGDSFALGLGVGDDQTWCYLLEALAPGIESVNLGHGGYGIDQAYLLYARVAEQLDYDVHLFTFTGDDFRRMGLRRFVGYDKPRFQWRDGALELQNVPVPRPSRLRHWLIVNQDIVALRVLDLGRRVLNRLGATGRDRGTPRDVKRQITLALLERVAARNRADGSIPIFVLLEESSFGSPDEAEWAEFLSGQLPERGLPFIDLTRPFRDLPVAERRRMFNPAWGHYSSAGNAWVAARIGERLREIPEAADRLGLQRRPQSP